MTGEDEHVGGAIRWARSCAAVAAGIGALALLGWQAGIAGLKAPIPGTYAMQPLTAVGLLAAAGAVAGAAGPSKAMRRASAALALLTVLLGLQALVQNAFDVDVGTDRLLYAADVLRQKTVAYRTPGRMAGATAIVFVIVGIALQLVRSPSAVGRQAFVLLVTAGALLTASGLAGAILDLRPGAALGLHAAMAVHTALGCGTLLLGIAALGWNARAYGVLRGASRESRQGRRVLAAVLVGVLIVQAGVRVGMPQTVYTQDARIAVAALLSLALFVALVHLGTRRVRRAEAQRAAALADLQSAQAALRAGEQRFRQLADALPQIVWIAHGDGRVDYFNRRWHDYVGEFAAANAERAWLQAVHPDDREAMLRRWTRAIAGDGDFESEHRLRRADGAYHWFLARAVRHEVPGAAPLWFGTATDVQQQRETTQALQAVDRRKDVFLATLAHELRNPLAPIRSAAQILAHPGLRGEQLAWAQGVIQRQTEAMARLLDDLLDISRITQGKLVLRRAPTELARIVDQALETVQPLVRGKGHQLRVHLPGEPLIADVDPLRIGQVLANLLSNAAKYTDPGGTIDVYAEGDADAVVLRVRDTGVGLSPEAREHVFEMFAQLDGVARRAEGGLGVGLALVRGLVTMHGGTVEVRSEGAGRGSEFVVRLPRSAPDAPVAPAPSTRAPAGRRDRRHVLVADDNRDAADALGMLLTLAGHDVRVAYDGRRALETAAAERPEVAVLDIGMPERDGYDVARSMRDAPWGADIRLIAVTGWGQEHDRARARAAGFDHHLTKPVDGAALEALVQAGPRRRSA